MENGKECFLVLEKPWYDKEYEENIKEAVEYNKREYPQSVTHRAFYFHTANELLRCVSKQETCYGGEDMQGLRLHTESEDKSI